MSLAQGHNAGMMVRLKPATSQYRVKHSATELSHCAPYDLHVVGYLTPSINLDKKMPCIPRGNHPGFMERGFICVKGQGVLLLILSYFS